MFFSPEVRRGFLFRAILLCLALSLRHLEGLHQLIAHQPGVLLIRRLRHLARSGLEVRLHRTVVLLRHGDGRALVDVGVALHGPLHGFGEGVVAARRERPKLAGEVFAQRAAVASASRHHAAAAEPGLDVHADVCVDADGVLLTSQ